MKSLRLTASLAAAILTAAILTPAARAQERIEVPWAELGPALAGHIVSTVLPDGTVLRGHVLDVSAEQLRFEANKTSNGALYPKGELSLARNQLKVFSYTQKRGRGRAIGAAIGAAANRSGLIGGSPRAMVERSSRWCSQPAFHPPPTNVRKASRSLAIHENRCRGWRRGIP